MTNLWDAMALAPSDRSKNIPDRFLELDVLRGLAIFAVMVFHYTTRYNQIYGTECSIPFDFPLGSKGVDLFFIISGFVICMSLEKTQHIIDFVVARVSRLYPAYWVAVIVVFIVVRIFSLPGREVTLSQALMNLSMLQSWLKVPHVDGAYWALSVVLSFYVIMSICYQMKLLRHIELICIIWLLAALSDPLLKQIVVLSLPYRVSQGLLSDYANLFIAGIMFYRLKMHGNSIIRHLLVVSCLFLPWLLTKNLETLMLTSCFFASLYLFIWGHLSFIILKPLVFLGEISYCLYIMHQNIGFVIMRNLFNYNVNALVIVVFPMLISLILATLLAFYVERPASAAIRIFYEKRRHVT